MREIKFRAWDKADSRFLDFSEAERIKFQLSPNGLIVVFGDEWATGDFELVEYIGLKDKNGVEIYEGDVVLLDGIPTEVKYGIQEVDAFEGMGWNLWSFYDDDGSGYKANGVRLTSELEVIGNIYENPELVK